MNIERDTYVVPFCMALADGTWVRADVEVGGVGYMTDATAAKEARRSLHRWLYYNGGNGPYNTSNVAHLAPMRQRALKNMHPGVPTLRIPYTPDATPSDTREERHATGCKNRQV